MRVARMFTWKDYDGVEFRTKIIQSTRKEFEQARDEKDPEIIAQLSESRAQHYCVTKL